MKAKHPAQRLPKARIAYTDRADLAATSKDLGRLSMHKWRASDFLVAVIPCRTRAEARAIVKLHSMTREERETLQGSK